MTATTTVKVFSFGGGVQSTAALVLAAQGKIDYRTFIFCNVGADSENPATLDYVHSYSIPYAATHGLDLYEIHKTRKDGTRVTLYTKLTQEGSRSVGIPVRMASSGAPGRRSCTVDFKIRLTDAWLKRRQGVGAILAKERRYRTMGNALLEWARVLGQDPAEVAELEQRLQQFILLPRPLAVVGLGISTDEWHRARSESGVEWKQLDYPLLDLGISREQCKAIIAEAGLPEPPQSSCWFCPMHTTQRWRDMRRDTPALFDQAADLEATLNRRRALLGRDPVYLHRRLIPLAQAIPAPAIQREDNTDDAYNADQADRGLRQQQAQQDETDIEEQELCNVEGGCML